MCYSMSCKTLLYSLFFIFCTVLSSCGPMVIYETNQRIPGAVWNEENKLYFEIPVADTVSLYNLFINIRNTGDYKYSNLYIFMDVFQPDGRIERDTIECILADPQGKWLGKSGSGSVWENHILFNRHTRFPKAGKYVFRFEQAMREKELEDIMDVGLAVEMED